MVDNRDSGVCCAMIGYFLNGERVAARHDLPQAGDVRLVEALYSAAGIEGLSELDGLFSVFVLDRKRHRGYLLQDELASDLPLYYAVSPEAFLFSTSLKQLLGRWPYPRKPNLEACYDFLHAGSTFFANLVPNGNTLVQHIYKVPPNSYVEVDASSGVIRKRPLTRASRTTSGRQAKRQLMGVIDASIDALHARLSSTDISMSLSGGFDSNYMIHRLRTLSDAPFRAFTVGGKKVNEIPQASAIAQIYENVDHITAAEDSAFHATPGAGHPRRAGTSGCWISSSRRSGSCSTVWVSRGSIHFCRERFGTWDRPSGRRHSASGSTSSACGMPLTQGSMGS